MKDEDIIYFHLLNVREDEGAPPPGQCVRIKTYYSFVSCISPRVTSIFANLVVSIMMCPPLM